MDEKELRLLLRKIEVELDFIKSAQFSVGKEEKYGRKRVVIHHKHEKSELRRVMLGLRKDLIKFERALYRYYF